MSRFARTTAPLLASFGLACTTPIDVSYDERTDFSQFRTWNWLSGAEPTVDAPDVEPARLDARLAQLVERALRARGFRRSRRSPDLLVSCHLRVRRQSVVAYTTTALQELSSFHSDGSYQVQVSSSEIETHERGRLTILVSDGRRGRAVWRGEFERRFPEFAPHLESAVSSLFDAFPPAGLRRPLPAPRETPEMILGRSPPDSSPPASGVSS